MRKIMVLILVILLVSSCTNEGENSQLAKYEEEIESLELKLKNAICIQWNHGVNMNIDYLIMKILLLE